MLEQGYDQRTQTIKWQEKEGLKCHPRSPTVCLSRPSISHCRTEDVGSLGNGATLSFNLLAVFHCMSGNGSNELDFLV